jgi:hypothetical protein
MIQRFPEIIIRQKTPQNLHILMRCARKRVVSRPVV